MRSKWPESMLKQTAVYWANPVNDGFGAFSYDTAVDLSVRWEDKSVLFVDAGGNEVTSRAVVYVATDLTVGEYLMLGEVDDLSSAEEEPEAYASAYMIRAVEKIPSVRSSTFLRKVFLAAKGT